jgi:hypothetical protein
MTEALKTKEGFTIYRAAEAPALIESGCITPTPMSGIPLEGLTSVLKAGYSDGEEIKVLCNIPGFSLVYSWFKPGFPLPLHSHNADCLYYIVSGSLRLGTEDLGPRDTFFVPCDVPYTYKVGPEGLEILEFRHETHFNFVNLAKGQPFWDRAVKAVEENREDWKKVKRPALNA